MRENLEPRGMRAVLFDMDGTLIDSEIRSEQVIVELLSERGLPCDESDLVRFHGVTWAETEAMLVADHPQLAGQGVARWLGERFHQSFVDDPPPEIPGAAAAFREAARHCRVGVVSSSDRMAVERAVGGLGLLELCAVTVCGEDVTLSKPNPEPYRKAAEALGVDPARCVVFEDSTAGLASARAAGMWTVAITAGGPRDPDSCDGQVVDYTHLAAGFFERIVGAR